MISKKLTLKALFQIIIFEFQISKWAELMQLNSLKTSLFDFPFLKSIFESRTPNSELRITKWTKLSLNKSTFDIRYSLFVILSNLNYKFRTLKWIKLFNSNSFRSLFIIWPQIATGILFSFSVFPIHSSSSNPIINK